MPNPEDLPALAASELSVEGRAKPAVWVAGLTFTGGADIKLGRNDIVVVVGPNNAGKTATLRFIRDRLANPHVASSIVRDITYVKSGSVEDLQIWLSTVARTSSSPTGGTQYAAFGVEFDTGDAERYWTDKTFGLRRLTRFFCHLLTADERLEASNPVRSIAVTREPPSHPLHFLLMDDELEIRLSDSFRAAFGIDMVVHRAAGAEIPLYAGERPKPQAGEDRISLGYVRELEKLPTLKSQGDGLRSFAGVLLYSAVGPETIQLIDEPEAFLHPPQARLLGRMLGHNQGNPRQLFVATHSGDVLRGFLDSSSKNLRVLRIQRKASDSVVHELSNEKIAAIWADTLLRNSNILDGIFHERVILCESDADCRFYSALVDALDDLNEKRVQRTDVMCTHVGGKARLPMAARALTELGVPTRVVADFDIISEEHPLREIVEILGGRWTTLEGDWRLVRNAILSKKPELDANDVRTQIEGLLAQISGPVFTEVDRGRIQAILRRSSAWSHAKQIGEAFIPNGDASVAGQRLFSQLRRLGLFVVPVGEIEGFVRTIGGHGPAWVNAAIERDLARDPELEIARVFVKELLA